MNQNNESIYKIFGKLNMQYYQLFISITLFYIKLSCTAFLKESKREKLKIESFQFLWQFTWILAWLYSVFLSSNLSIAQCNTSKMLCLYFFYFLVIWNYLACRLELVVQYCLFLKTLLKIYTTQIFRMMRY
jgi:hypothetical protein